MFDLEKAITDWRRQMLSVGVTSSKILAELETHLREDIEIQTRGDVDAQEAFVLSIVRLGHADALQLEFAKTRAVPRIMDKVRLLFCLMFVAAIVWLSGFTFEAAGFTPSEWFVASAAVLACLLIAGFWTRAVRYLPVIYNKRRRNVIELVLFVSGIIYSNLFCTFVLPYFERNIGDKILPAIWLWAVFPIALFWALASGIEQAARDKNSISRQATS